MIAERAFAGLLFAGIFTLWVPARWAYACLQIALLGAAAFWGITRQPRTPPLVWLLAAAAAWGVVQEAAGTTVYAAATREKTLDWAAWLAAAWLAGQIHSGRAAAWRFQQRIALFGAALAAVSLLARFTAKEKVFWFFDGGHPGPWMGPFVYENQYAAFIQLSLPPVVLMSFRRLPHPAAIAAAALMIASVFVSGSVAGAGIVLAESIALLAIVRIRLKVDWPRIGAAAALLAAMTGVFGTVTGWDALLTDLRRREPFQVRQLLAESTIEMALDRPWTGFGLGTWPVVYPAYAKFDDGAFDNQAHNDWLQWAAEGGLPFVLLVAAIALLIARRVRREFWGLGLLFVLAHCLVEYHFQQRPGFGCLYFAIAGVVASPRSGD